MSHETACLMGALCWPNALCENTKKNWLKCEQARGWSRTATTRTG